MAVEGLVGCTSSWRHLRTSMVRSARQSLTEEAWLDECRKVAQALNIPIEKHRGLHARQYAVMELERPLATEAHWIRLLGERCLIWVCDLAVPEYNHWSGEVLVDIYLDKMGGYGQSVQTILYDAVPEAYRTDEQEGFTPEHLLDNWWDYRLADLTNLRRM